MDNFDEFSIELVKCDCYYEDEFYNTTLNVYQVITDIPYLEGSFIMEYSESEYTPEDIIDALKRDVLKNDLERMTGYVYFKDEIMNKNFPQNNFLRQLSREIKLKKII